MTNQEILSHIDHTILKPFATFSDVKKVCDEAIFYKTASVCIPPCYVKKVAETYKNSLNICTVIGFPLGYSSTESKITETKTAIADGANEIDMVINICDVKNNDFEAVKNEILAIKNVCDTKILKVIIETCYLTENEKIALCDAVTTAGADYIKTSTGFGTSGAVLSDIELFKKHIGKNVKIKAAGGVKTVLDMEKFLLAGCDRIGTSSAISLINEGKYQKY